MATFFWQDFLCRHYFPHAQISCFSIGKYPQKIFEDVRAGSMPALISKKWRIANGKFTDFSPQNNVGYLLIKISAQYSR